MYCGTKKQSATFGSSHFLILQTLVMHYNDSCLCVHLQAKIAEVHGKASDFKLSPKFDSSTNREVLLISNSEQVYRHSTLADYVLYREG